MSTSPSSDDSKLHTLRNGAVSALVACTALQPLDVLKTRLQQPQQQQQSVGKRLSLLSQCTFIIRNEGVLALWKGLTPTLLRNVPGSAVYFLLLQQSKKYSSGSNFDNLLLVGSFSRVVAGTLVMPLTVIKTQYESTLYQHHSILEAFRTIIRTNGFRGLFAGFYATVLRDAPYAGIYISLYEHLKQKLERVWVTDEGYTVTTTAATTTTTTTMITLVSSSIAGFTACLVTHPFDVLRTRKQLLIQSKQQQQQPLNLFSGLIPRLLRKTLSTTITWTIFEELMMMRRQLKTTIK
jgi:solute carrier family 25 protein 38